MSAVSLENHLLFCCLVLFRSLNLVLEEIISVNRTCIIRRSYRELM